MTPDFEIEIIDGPGVVQALDRLAELRVHVFREFPYLYDGDMDYEREYLRSYAESSNAFVVIVKVEGRVVGAASAIPMEEEIASVTTPFLDAGLDPESIVYFGESLLLRDFRGHGVGVRFFTERENWARSLGGRKMVAFCNVLRDEGHPRRPPTWQPLNGFWRRRGFEERPDLETTFEWKDLDEDKASPKRMRFWTKLLEG